jgi:YbgC/YbaW family acyl-CoA thioester hydrolase
MPTPVPAPFTFRRRVEFADTDMAGVMHFANHFRFMEAAEHAFFRSLGLLIHADDGGRMHGWVRVHAACDYLAPARYMDLVEVAITLTDRRDKALSYDFEFRIVERTVGDMPGGPFARGRMTVVYVECGPGDTGLRARTMPDDVRVAMAPHATSRDASA